MLELTGALLFVLVLFFVLFLFGFFVLVDAALRLSTFCTVIGSRVRGVVTTASGTAFKIPSVVLANFTSFKKKKDQAYLFKLLIKLLGFEFLNHLESRRSS